MSQRSQQMLPKRPLRVLLCNYSSLVKKKPSAVSSANLSTHAVLSKRLKSQSTPTSPLSASLFTHHDKGSLHICFVAGALPHEPTLCSVHSDAPPACTAWTMALPCGEGKPYWKRDYVHAVCGHVHRLMDGQMPGRTHEEAAAWCQTDKSERDTHGPQSRRNDGRAGAKSRSPRSRPSQRCNVSVINCQSPTVCCTDVLSQWEALITATATVALTLACIKMAFHTHLSHVCPLSKNWFCFSWYEQSDAETSLCVICGGFRHPRVWSTQLNTWQKYTVMIKNTVGEES